MLEKEFTCTTEEHEIFLLSGYGAEPMFFINAVFCNRLKNSGLRELAR